MTSGNILDNMRHKRYSYAYIFAVNTISADLKNVYHTNFLLLNLSTYTSLNIVNLMDVLNARYLK